MPESGAGRPGRASHRARCPGSALLVPPVLLVPQAMRVPVLVVVLVRVLAARARDSSLVGAGSLGCELGPVFGALLALGAAEGSGSEAALPFPGFAPVPGVRSDSAASAPVPSVRSGCRGSGRQKVERIGQGGRRRGPDRAPALARARCRPQAPCHAGARCRPRAPRCRAVLVPPAVVLVRGLAARAGASSHVGAGWLGCGLGPVFGALLALGAAEGSGSEAALPFPGFAPVPGVRSVFRCVRSGSLCSLRL